MRKKAFIILMSLAMLFSLMPAGAGFAMDEMPEISETEDALIPDQTEASYGTVTDADEAEGEVPS